MHGAWEQWYTVDDVWRDARREPCCWCCRPALTEAAAWSEVEAARPRDGEGGLDCCDGDDMAMPGEEEDDAEKVVDGARGERPGAEGGRELRSGVVTAVGGPATAPCCAVLSTGAVLCCTVLYSAPGRFGST